MDAHNGQFIPDLLLINANIITLDRFRPKADWVATGGGKILSLGDKEELGLSRIDVAEIIDCKGRTVLPGFIDPHLHLLSFAESLMTLNLKPDYGIRSVADMQSSILRLSRDMPQRTWIRGKGYDEFYLAEKRHPNKAMELLRPNLK